ncbi:MAG TPA: mechanosensitive ion channel domain-containing protein [Candidatus Deferrimicrobiaceae bacterium]|nr:mechanosensitive ion channel domain-containing protein [Candidatus Deferrimicrobiaceae bacterium]
MIRIPIIVYQIALPVSMDLLLRIAIVGLILLATWIISIILKSLVSKAKGKLSPSMSRQMKRLVTWITWFAGILIALSQVGLDLTILLTLVALSAIVLAIALRHVLSNLVSYGVIKSYEPFKLGDWVQVGKFFGRVVDITWADTVLMTPDNETVYVPNSKITQNIVINKTTPGGTRIAISIVISNALDISEVEKTLLDISSELKEELIPEFVPEVRVTNLNTQSVRLALLLRINNPAKGKLIASRVRKRAKERLYEIQQRKMSS